MVSEGKVFLTLVRVVGDVVSGGLRCILGWKLTQWRRRAYARVQLASVEMMKPPSPVGARGGLDYGCPRCDEDV